MGGVRKVILKDNELFAVLDSSGELPRIYDRELGLYLRDTRYLDTWEMTLNGTTPTVLAAEAMPDVRSCVFTSTNQDMYSKEYGARIPRDRLGILRVVSVSDDQLFEHVEFTNYDQVAHTVVINRRAGSRFSDIFEVRGSVRERRGETFPPSVGGLPNVIRLAYRGVNEKHYQTTIHSDRAFDKWTVHEKGDVSFSQSITLAPRAKASVRYTIGFTDELRREIHGQAFDTLPMAEHLLVVQDTSRISALGKATLHTDSEIINRAIDQSRRDIVSLLSFREGILYPDAGIPWFCAPFGRDGLTTAYQLLPWYPDPAVGVLSFVFSHLGVKFDAFTDEEPGRAFHEMRYGEMAQLREIPFVPYFGSIDATPLALILLGEYVRWTHRIDRLREWWEPALSALNWIRRRLKESSNGFLAYECQRPTGLVNQGWKDSHDSVMHADGRLADAPVALCEVQAYVYRALKEMSSMARLMSDGALADELQNEAAGLRERFNRNFWDQAGEYVYLAKVKGDEPLHVRGSNMGQCLWGKILDEAQSAAVAKQLTEPDFFSGHGIRTLSQRERSYNPLSYHNGSIWPHDNSLIAEGFRYGGCQGPLRTLSEGLFDVLRMSEDYRMPELFCGFPKQAISPPVPYEVACKPQAWAAGSLFLLMKACLGMSSEFEKSLLTFREPFLPSQLKSLEVRGLGVGDDQIDFVARQGQTTASIEILKKPKRVSVIVQK